jgi:hypothetical protein
MSSECAILNSAGRAGIARSSRCRHFTCDAAVADSEGPSGAQVATSIGIGFIPLVGSGQSIIELIFGWDYITGEPMDRRLAAAGILAGVVPGGKGALKGGARAWGNLRHAPVDADAVLSSASRWLGDGYREIAPGVFRSSDGLRQFRMTNSDLIPTHGRIGHTCTLRRWIRPVV